jgi:thymidylate synthase
MHLAYRSANWAFHGLIQGIHDRSIPTRESPSRNGPVLQVEAPVIVTYRRPLERVLFNETRDCNPFFHVFESLWMLAGRNDVEPLDRYNSNIKNYSDDGKTSNGAYGYRWRHALAKPSFYEERDQLKIIVEHLSSKPESRRVVLQMWNVEDDLLKIDSSRDVCCNTNVYFSINPGDGNLRWTEASGHAPGLVDPPKLDMTVCNRSNDLVWGMLGANVVHFSFLQEYLAACLGVEVGVYHQFSNNLHVYLDKWTPEPWLLIPPERCPYHACDLKLVPLVADSATFDREVAEFINRDWANAPGYDGNFNEPFLATVAEPMCRAFYRHKQRDYGAALVWCKAIAADDWRIAAETWVNRRKLNWEQKNVLPSSDQQD